MKKVVLASLLAIAGAASMPARMVAQQPAGGAGSIQMSQEEYAAYNNANTQTSPAAKAQAFEAYLTAYPKSAVKADVLNQLLYLYSSTGDKAKTLDAADRLLAVDPNNLRALNAEVYFRRADADAMTDAAAKVAALDKVAQYAQTGLAATKPKDMTDDDFKKMKDATMPTFESAIADDDLAKKDNAGAIAALKTELAANEPATHAPGPVLLDVFNLANAYYTSNPPDFLNCAWYATRAASFAGQYAGQITPLATYCYKKYHGSADGYATLQQMVQTQIDPPADLSTKVTPAPKPEDIVAQTIAGTPDLSTLAISDKEFILQYGTKTDDKTQKTYADEVFDTVKGKSVQFPQVLVLDGSTADKLVVAVTDDAQASKTADFSFTMKEPLKEVPATGTKVDIEGVYGSYTSSPLMINMTDGALVEKKAAKKAAPVHRAAPRKK